MARQGRRSLTGTPLARHRPDGSGRAGTGPGRRHDASRV